MYNLLRSWQSDLKEQWASGAFTDQGQFATAIMNAKAIGNCETCERVIAIEYEDILGENDGQGSD